MINVAVQYATPENINYPSEELFIKWANAAQINIKNEVELTIRIVNAAEIAQLNNLYRKKNSVTNVLAFPFEIDENIGIALLGDLVICAEIVKTEAQQQSKTEIEHWAHLVIHGVLHLQGYDHITTGLAEKMEHLEIQILNTLGYNNPYQVQDS
ncbi:Metal-dependent hydrolase YbeY, involved in rRNA and/or ribosome maturation and assembly [hydrothermal vent metagenome]|uniref:Metal-dependent hydrolase YbeY, involved in rRNA and/or ribosome maturation and assembly n=1 Tax=hydrothermal vent metagenome TaxID=652676 RepID=A0A3B1AHQ2_9ZZZZ